VRSAPAALWLGRATVVTGYAVVPLGSWHVETGQLLRRNRGLVLRLDDGGEWRLEAPSSALRYLGKRVRVEGVRDAFDLIAAKRIETADPDGTERQGSIVKWFAGVLCRE